MPQASFYCFWFVTRCKKKKKEWSQIASVKLLQNKQHVNGGCVSKVITFGKDLAFQKATIKKSDENACYLSKILKQHRAFLISVVSNLKFQPFMVYYRSYVRKYYSRWSNNSCPSLHQEFSTINRKEEEDDEETGSYSLMFHYMTLN